MYYRSPIRNFLQNCFRCSFLLGCLPRRMPVPENLQRAWDEAKDSIGSKESPDKALAVLRSVAWDNCETDVQRAKTLSLAAELYMIKADIDSSSRKTNLKQAYKNYSNAIIFINWW